MRPIAVVPRPSPEPFYVKLRAEADQASLEDKAGKMYLGFHLDPLYHVHWNNLAEPIQFEIEAPDGVVLSASSGQGPKVASPTDSDPREFLLDIGNASGKTLIVTARYFACSDTEGWCKPVTQHYELVVKRDPDAGLVLSRNEAADSDRKGGKSSADDMATRFMGRDGDGDGKVSKEEAPPSMRRRFEKIDTNGDGGIDRAEIERHLEGVRRR